MIICTSFSNTRVLMRSSESADWILSQAFLDSRENWAPVGMNASVASSGGASRRQRERQPPMTTRLSSFSMGGVC
jgi:hypothetical protein